MASIAEELGVSLGTIHSDLQGAKEQWTEAQQQAIAEHVAEHIRRTEELYTALLRGVERGEARSVEVALKVLERQAALLGLDQPDKVDSNQVQKVTVEYVDTPIQHDSISTPAPPSATEDPEGGKTL